MRVRRHRVAEAVLVTHHVNLVRAVAAEVNPVSTPNDALALLLGHHAVMNRLGCLMAGMNSAEVLAYQEAYRAAA